MTQSRSPSPSTSPTSVASGKGSVPYVALSVTFPAPSPRMIPPLFWLLLAVATSSVPLPSRSAQFSIHTAPPADVESPTVNVPSPLPRLTTMDWLVRAPTARSMIPSSFMSAAAKAHSPAPPPS